MVFLVSGRQIEIYLFIYFLALKHHVLYVTSGKNECVGRDKFLLLLFVFILF